MGESLKEKTIKGLVIQFISTIGLKLLSFIQIIVFARIFAPNDFGIFATASLVVSFVMLFTQMGVNQHIIRENRDPKKVIDTAFSLDIVIGFLFFTIIFISAPFAADFFKNPDLVLYIRFLSYSAFGAALGLPAIMWVKDMRFGMAKLPVFLSVVGNIVVAYISAVFFHLGTWSLFLGGLAGFLGNTIVTWALAPYRPKPRFDTDAAKKLYSFGWPLFFSSILGFIVWQGDDLLIRYFWGTEELGFYTFAFYIPMFLLKIVEMINTVLFPVFSKVQDSKEKLEYAFNMSNKYIALFCAPLGMGLFAFAPEIVHYVFTDKWMPIVPLLRLFAIAFTIRATTGFNWGQIALAKGRTKYILFVEIISAVLMGTIGIYLIYNYKGLGGAYYNVLQLIIFTPLVRFKLIKEEIGNLNFLKMVIRPLVASTALAILFYFISTFLDTLFLFILSIIVYFLMYVISIIILDKTICHEIKNILVNRC